MHPLDEPHGDQREERGATVAWEPPREERTTPWVGEGASPPIGSPLSPELEEEEEVWRERRRTAEELKEWVRREGVTVNEFERLLEGTGIRSQFPSVVSDASEADQNEAIDRMLRETFGPLEDCALACKDAILRMRYKMRLLLVDPERFAFWRNGGGGSGEVWATLSKHGDDRRVIAVKRLRHPTASNIDRFGREDWKIRKHQLPFFPHSIEPMSQRQGLRLEPWQYSIAMSYEQGWNLKELLRDGPLDVATASRLLPQLFLMLYWMHKVDLLHRDIKTLNFFLSEDHPDGVHLKLLDLGLARGELAESRQITDERRRGLFGTVEYMAPEVIQGEKPTVRSDLWSAANVGAEILTGHVPYTGRTQEETVTKRLRLKPGEALELEVPVFPPTDDPHERRFYAEWCGKLCEIGHPDPHVRLPAESTPQEQLEKLEELLHFAFQRSPYAGEVSFNDFSNLKVWASTPIPLHCPPPVPRGGVAIPSRFGSAADMRASIVQAARRHGNHFLHELYGELQDHHRPRWVIPGVVGAALTAVGLSVGYLLQQSPHEEEHPDKIPPLVRKEKDAPAVVLVLDGGKGVRSFRFEAPGVRMALEAKGLASFSSGEEVCAWLFRPSLDHFHGGSRAEVEQWLAAKKNALLPTGLLLSTGQSTLFSQHFVGIVFRDPSGAVFVCPPGKEKEMPPVVQDFLGHFPEPTAQVSAVPGIPFHPGYLSTVQGRFRQLKEYARGAVTP